MTALPILIDTDPGVDDAAALLLALASPELDLRAVTAVAGNVPLDAVLANTGKILALAGRPDIPFHAGCAGPLVRDQVFGRHSGLGAFGPDLLPVTPVSPGPVHAVNAIARAALASADQEKRITICALGPLTNLALALVLDPLIAKGIERIVIMGGALAALGNRVPWADFNMLADPHAAATVFGSGVPIDLVPLDTTFQALVTDDHLRRLDEEAGAAGRCFADLFRASDRSDPARFGRPGGPVHDAVVVAWLLWPDLFSSASAAIGVEYAGRTKGYLFADFHGISDLPINARVLRAVEEEAFLDRLFERLSRLDTNASQVSRT